MSDDDSETTKRTNKYRIIDPSEFAAEWHGHKIAHLRLILEELRKQNERIVFFVGDSSLDNKAWVRRRAAPIRNGYSNVFDRPMVVDVAFNLNAVFCDELHVPIAALNCSVEATTLGERDRGKSLWPQDEFVRDNITENDILVISVGGNDIALRPSCCTICSMCCLIKCSTDSCVQNGSACGYGHFKDLLRDDYLQYVRALISKCKPRMIIPAMIYYPDENPNSPSWANFTLGAISYNTNPKRVQDAIDRVFKDCLMPMPELLLKFEREHKEQQQNQNSSSSSNNKKTTVVTPIEWSKAMNSKNSKEYDNRVEPSALGGLKMAKLVSTIVMNELGLNKNNSDNNKDDDDNNASTKTPPDEETIVAKKNESML